MKTKILILLFIFSGSPLVHAQDFSQVDIVNIDSLDIPSSVLKRFKPYSKDRLDETMRYLQREGYLLSSWTVLSSRDDTALVSIEKGPQVRWASIQTDSIDPFFLQGAGISAGRFEEKVVDYLAVASTMETMLDFAEEHGYPFATIRLCAISFEDSVLQASLCFNKNRLILFDTLQLLGDAFVSDNYLQLYAGIQPGEPYRESLIRNLDASLDELPFVKRTQRSVVRFSGDRAKPVVYLDERNASRFDLVMGFLPNNEITGRLIVTGQGNLNLQNSFGQGEKIQVQFSKLESSTKSLQSAFTYPYLPRVPLGIDAGLDLFLRDSTFLERKARGGIIYQFSGNDFIKAFYSTYNSDVLSIDTAQIIQQKTLPAIADVILRSYGLQTNLERLDYLYNPRKGWAINVSGSIGRKQIRQNATITSLVDPGFPEFDFTSLYDSVQLKSLALEYAYDVQFFQPLSRFTTLLFRMRGAANLNDQLFGNERYRIGGNNLLRGFDELSLLVSEYHIASIEARYLLSQNAYAGLFTDIGYTSDRSLTVPVYSQPYGFGAIFTFETKAGIFGLTYALGGSPENPVLFRNAKVHFGYVNYF